MPTILITGAGGQLGQELQTLSNHYPRWTFLAPTRQELDITDQVALPAFFAKHQPDYCLNTAAYTAVDKAETEQELAYAINAQAAAAIARLCQTHDTQLIHYSTDYAYKGDYNRPLLEDDATLGDGIYAKSKLQGDQMVLQELPAAMVIRTSWVYSSFGHNFVKTMLRLGQQRDALSVVFDQIGTPTYAYDLAAASLKIIEKIESGTVNKEDASGIFHYSNEGVCSWYDFAIRIFELSGIQCTVSPIESKDYPTPASRPHYSVLNKAKIKNTFELSIPHWQDGLERCLKKLGKER
ncbi:MAG: dTDP-4-dehydrorhamnose reductase [Bacteroidota bacterium]